MYSQKELKEMYLHQQTEEGRIALEQKEKFMRSISKTTGTLHEVGKVGTLVNEFTGEIKYYLKG